MPAAPRGCPLNAAPRRASILVDGLGALPLRPARRKSMKIANALALAALLGSAATANAQAPQQTPPTPAPAAAAKGETAKAEAKKTEKAPAKATSHAAHHK